MVVWVYAGGGGAEAGGFVPLLQRHFPVCSFERRLPRPKPGPRPPLKVIHSSYPGHTGKALLEKIDEDIRRNWDGTAQAFLALDDTDGKDPSAMAEALRDTVYKALAEQQVPPRSMPVVVALAVPEIEIWLIGDWDNTFRKELGAYEGAIRHELASQRGLNFQHPERFVVHGPNGEYWKFSSVLIEVLERHWVTGVHYSKAVDTSRLLLRVDPATVGRRCPHFRRFWEPLKKLCPVPE